MLVTDTEVLEKAVAEFEPSHADALRPGWRNVLGADRESMLMFFRAYEERGKGYTALVAGEPIAAAGVLVSPAGRAEAWGIVGPKIREYPLFVHRSALHGFQRLIDEYKLRRIETTVLFGDETATRWIERMGFMAEGLMIGYGNSGESHIRYARLVQKGGRRVLLAEEH